MIKLTEIWFYIRVTIYIGSMFLFFLTGSDTFIFIALGIGLAEYLKLICERLEKLRV